MDVRTTRSPGGDVKSGEESKSKSDRLERFGSRSNVVGVDEVEVTGCSESEEGITSSFDGEEGKEEACFGGADSDRLRLDRTTSDEEAALCNTLLAKKDVVSSRDPPVKVLMP